MKPIHLNKPKFMFKLGIGDLEKKRLRLTSMQEPFGMGSLSAFFLGEGFVEFPFLDTRTRKCFNRVYMGL